MDFPDLKTQDEAQVRALRATYLMLMEDIRQGKNTAPISYAEAVTRKNACNGELSERGLPITASGISTPESRAKLQRVGDSIN